MNEAFSFLTCPGCLQVRNKHACRHACPGSLETCIPLDLQSCRCMQAQTSPHPSILQPAVAPTLKDSCWYSAPSKSQQASVQSGASPCNIKVAFGQSSHTKGQLLICYTKSLVSASQLADLAGVQSQLSLWFAACPQASKVVLGEVVKVVGGPIPGWHRQDEKQEGCVRLVAAPPQLAQRECHRGQGDVHAHVRQRLHKRTQKRCQTSSSRLNTLSLQTWRPAHLCNSASCCRAGTTETVQYIFLCKVQNIDRS